MVLEQIIKHKHELNKIRAETIWGYEQNLTPSKRSLEKALQQQHTSFICEIKPASPSEGLLRNQPISLENLCDIAQIYAPFADAISVLADEKFFHGSHALVKRISEEQKCPILCKDVIVAPSQIIEARYHGADAVLLMMAVLSNQQYEQCAELATRLSLDIICEVHSREELERALKLKPKIIGINNRNLHTLEIDLSTTEQLISLIPKSIIVIAESGFSRRDQILRHHSLVDGFLIGSSLMKSSRIDLALRELIFGRIKICGLCNSADARLAYESGAYYGGLNLSKVSKRSLSLESALEIRNSAPLEWGAVFVNQPIDEIIASAQKLKLSFVQLHGHEGEDYVRDLRRVLSLECEIWKVFRVKEELTTPTMQNADLLLFDSYDHKEFGGTGKPFDWTMLSTMPELSRFGLAGGIDAQNIRRAAYYKPFVIDIASGAESGDARKKSPLRLKQIFDAARG